MKGKRYPGRLRADGQMKGYQLVAVFGWPDQNFRPPYASGARTRSREWRAGARRTKKLAGR